jgi:glycerophosphoryl diester phosphodiesterase
VRKLGQREPSGSARRPKFCSQPAPLICAHGGDISGGLANTMPAYRRALAHAAVSCVEVDVSRTRDDQLVALHQRQLLSIADGEFDRCGGASGTGAANTCTCRVCSHVAPTVLRAALETRASTRHGRLVACALCYAARTRVHAQLMHAVWLRPQLKWFGADNEASRVLTLQEALSALLGKGLKHIILDIKDGPPFGIEGFAAKSLAAVAAAACRECIVWAKEDDVVRDLVSQGHGAQAGFVMMNETADARARGMHKIARVQVCTVSPFHLLHGRMHLLPDICGAPRCH